MLMRLLSLQGDLIPMLLNSSLLNLCRLEIRGSDLISEQPGESFHGSLTVNIMNKLLVNCRKGLHNGLIPNLFTFDLGNVYKSWELTALSYPIPCRGRK